MYKYSERTINGLSSPKVLGTRIILLLVFINGEAVAAVADTDVDANADCGDINDVRLSSTSSLISLSFSSLFSYSCCLLPIIHVYYDHNNKIQQ